MKTKKEIFSQQIREDDVDNIFSAIPLDKAIEILTKIDTKYKNLGWEKILFAIDTEYDYDDSRTEYLSVVVSREESDKEYQDRLKKNREISKKVKATIAQKKIEVEKKEKELYLKLKKKYE